LMEMGLAEGVFGMAYGRDCYQSVPKSQQLPKTPTKAGGGGGSRTRVP
jgi:hypothetical protein